MKKDLKMTCTHITHFILDVLGPSRPISHFCYNDFARFLGTPLDHLNMDTTWLDLYQYDGIERFLATWLTYLTVQATEAVKTHCHFSETLQKSSPQVLPHVPVVVFLSTGFPN